MPALPGDHIGYWDLEIYVNMSEYASHQSLLVQQCSMQLSIKCNCPREAITCSGMPSEAGCMLSNSIEAAMIA